MNKTVAAIVGAALGMFVLGSIGYGLGYVFLAWFGPEDCCGLEGLYPLLIGTLVGALLGVLSGGLAGVIAARRRPLKLMRLVLLVGVGVALTWLGSLVFGAGMAENTLGIVVFLVVALVLPVLVWITDAWEPPDTSI